MRLISDQNSAFRKINSNQHIYVSCIVAICLASAFWAPLGYARATTAVGSVLLFLIDSKRPRNTAMISAVLLLSVFGVSFFSIVPSSFNLINDFCILMFDYNWRDAGLTWAPINIPIYIGSLAERLILIFSAFLMLGHFFTRFIKERNIAKSKPPLIHVPLIHLFAMSASITTVMLILHFVAQGSEIMGFARTILYPVTILFGLIIFCHLLDKKNNKLMGYATIFYIVVVFAIMSEARFSIFIMISLFLLISYKKSTSYSALLKLGFLSIVFGLMIVLVVQFIRYPEAVARYSKPSTSIENSSFNWDWFVSKLYWKVIYRQIETGSCLNSVVDQHWQQESALRDQLFWLEALVPRALWPEKPTLSLGKMYSLLYCGMPNVNNGHSSSITLLGEPIIKGGALGLYVHGGILIIGLTVFSLVARRYGDSGAVVCLSMLPWWINLEQHFGLYVANLVKFGLVIVGTYILILLVDKYVSTRFEHL